MQLNNYSNSLNSQTIEFTLLQEGYVELSVFNLQGKKTTTIVNNSLTAGKYHYIGETRNLPGGVYLAALKTGSGIRTIRIKLEK